MIEREISNSLRAETMTAALPFINKYSGKIIVVKYGGNAMSSEELKQSVMEDIVLLSRVGIRIVLVHGGGPDISEMMDRMGKKPVFSDGLRVTDQETVEIVQMVLAGKVNKDLVRLLQKNGGNAIGLCGLDGKMITAKQRSEKLGFVGDVTEVNTKPILDVLNAGYIPVISTIGVDAESNVYNINGDTAAAEIAASLKAERMILMTDIAGVLHEKDDPSSLIAKLTVSEAKQLQEEGIISGGMIPKIRCCVNAVEKGVKAVVILDGKVPHATVMELLTEEGAGTLITKGE